MPDTEIKSALYVDFDNVYGGLERTSLAAARAFARNPGGWLRWFELGAHEQRADAPQRRILSRRCYINPVAFGQYRHHFTIAGFQTIDCPSLTSHGKNSADISMALDIFEALQHKTHFDEFIILSADADFTPVLLRLREHDRLTAILSTDMTVRALKAAAAFAFEDHLFVQEALGVDDTPLLSPASATGGSQAGGPIDNQAQELSFVADILANYAQETGRFAINDVAAVILRDYPSFKDSSWLGFGRLRLMVDALVALRPNLRIVAEGGQVYLEPAGVANAVAATTERQPPADAAATKPDEALRAKILDFVEQAVTDSDGPVHGAALGLQIIQRFGSHVKRSEWLGAGSLSRLIMSGNRPGLAVAGYEIYDRRRSAIGEGLQSMPSNLADLPGDLVEFIEDLASVGWPELSPAQTALVIREMSRLIGEGVTERNPLSASVRDAIKDAVDEKRVPPNLAVSRAAVSFLLNSLIFDKVVFGPGCQSEEDLRRELSRTLINLIANRIGPPDEKTAGLVDQLLHGPVPEAVAGEPPLPVSVAAAAEAVWSPPVAPAWCDVVAVASTVAASTVTPPTGYAAPGVPESPAQEPVAPLATGAAEPTEAAGMEDTIAAIWSSRQGKSLPAEDNSNPPKRSRDGWWRRFSGD